MNTLTVIVILIIVFGAVIGFMRGLLRCLVGMLFSALSVLIAYLISPFMYGILVEKTSVDDYVTERISTMIEEDIEQKIKDEYFEKTGLELTDTDLLKSLKEKVYQYDPDKSDQANIINNLNIPKSLKKSLVDDNAYGEKTDIEADNFYDYIAKLIVKRAMKMISYVVSFLLISIIFAIIIIALKIVTKLPVIGGLNKIGGAILGALISLVIVWIMFVIFVNYPGQDFCKNAAKQIEESKILLYIQDNNFVQALLIGSK